MLDQLYDKMNEKQADLDQWFAEKLGEITPPIYSSADIRYTGYKDRELSILVNREAGLYEFAGSVSLDRLLSGVVFTQGVASPTGFEPVSQP